MTEESDEIAHTPGILWFEGESPAMCIAIRQAQQNLPTFEAVIDTSSNTEIPQFEDAAVKVFFPSVDEPARGEHMWVNDVSFRGDMAFGVLQNDANDIPGLVAGRMVQFTRDRISDWFYVVNGAAEGGYTIKLMLSRMSPEVFRQYCDDPPVCYFTRWYEDQNRVNGT
jgi:uncharacterized protein YegJ (DUF2314 family)